MCDWTTMEICVMRLPEDRQRVACLTKETCNAGMRKRAENLQGPYHGIRAK